MADPIVAPDVATTQPSATPAPDLTPITGAPAQPAPPSNAAVIPGDFTSSGAPQAVPAPNKTNNGGVGAGFASAANPQFSADETGNIRQSNPTPQNFKGLLGSVLGGALRGAAYGMAAEKGESGAAAAQRLREQANLQARQQAEQAYQNKRQQERDTLNHGLITAQTVGLQSRLKMEEGRYAEDMKKLGLETAELELTHKQHDEAMKQGEAAWQAEAGAHGIKPIHTLTDDPKNATYVDTEGNLVTPGTPSTGAGSVANLKGAGARSAIGKLKDHAANIANGQYTVTQNGKDGDQSGFNLYQTAKLDDVITKPFYYQLPTTLTHPDGTPVMRDVAVMPDGKTTFRDTRAQLNNANSMIDKENGRLAQQAQQKEQTLKQQNEALEPGLTKAKTSAENAKAALDRATAASLPPGGAGGGTYPPQGYAPPTQKDLMTMPVQDLHAKLKAAGAPEVPYLGTLQNVARYDTELEKAFTNTKRKGVSQTDRELAEDYITKWINPTFSSGNSNARVQFIRGWSNGNSGDGASIRRMNTATGHLGLLGQANQVLAQDQGGSSLPILNRIAEGYGLQTGSDPTLVYQAIANKAAAEAAGAVKGGSGSATDQEIEKAAQGFNPAWSPQQQSSWLRTQMQILAEADSTLRQVFHDNMQRTPEEAGRSILSSKNQQIMNQWVNSGSAPTGGAVNPNASLPSGIQLSPEAQAIANKYGIGK